MFVDTSDMRILHTNEHSGASAIEWCPTGRFVITTANWWMPRVCMTSHFLDQLQLLW